MTAKVQTPDEYLSPEAEDQIALGPGEHVEPDDVVVVIETGVNDYLYANGSLPFFGKVTEKTKTKGEITRVTTTAKIKATIPTPNL